MSDARRLSWRMEVDSINTSGVHQKGGVHTFQETSLDRDMLSR